MDSNTLHLEELDEPVQLQTLIDILTEENQVQPDYIHQFESLSNWQMKTLLDLGLQPQDYLLDIGCGMARLGVQAIAYLESGHYHGVEAMPEYVSAGKRLLAELDIEKDYSIHRNSTFDFGAFGQTFDYAIAHSVFTYLSASQIEDCIKLLSNVMNSGGEFLLTYVERRNCSGKLYGQSMPMVQGSFSDKYLEDLFESYASEYRVLDATHPTGQLVRVVTF